MNTDQIKDIAKRLSDWDAHDTLQQLAADEYQREQIATAQSEQAFAAAQHEYRLRMRAGNKRTDSTGTRP
jgi:hypothetical protein